MPWDIHPWNVYPFHRISEVCCLAESYDLLASESDVPPVEAEEESFFDDRCPLDSSDSTISGEIREQENQEQCGILDSEDSSFLLASNLMTELPKRDRSINPINVAGQPNDICKGLCSISWLPTYSLQQTQWTTREAKKKEANLTEIIVNFWSILFKSADSESGITSTRQTVVDSTGKSHFFSFLQLSLFSEWFLDISSVDDIFHLKINVTQE